MGVEHSLVHKATLENLRYKEPKSCHDDNTSPYSLGYLVPHFIVQAMNFLQSLKIV